MLILRLGNDGYLLGIPASVNVYLLTYATTFGFFLIATVQLIGILMSERSPIKVFQNLTRRYFLVETEKKLTSIKGKALGKTLEIRNAS